MLNVVKCKKCVGMVYMKNRLAILATGIIAFLGLAVGVYAASESLYVISLDDSVWEVIQQINSSRISNELLPLAVNDKMTAAAESRAQELIEWHYDNRPNGSTMETLLDEKGITYSVWGQCIAEEFANASAVTSAWLNYEPSAKGIMNPDFTHIGAAHGVEGNIWATLFTGTCKAERISIVPGDSGSTYAFGTEIDCFDDVMVLSCSEHGDSYIPLVAKMVDGYDKTISGKQILTASYSSQSVSFTVTIEPHYIEPDITAPDDNNDEVYVGYDDVDNSAWYADAIKCVTQEGLFNGTTPNTFSPDATMTRAMFVTVLGRLSENLGIEIDSGNSSFTDLEPGWYYDYVRWAESENLVNGYDAYTFGVDDPITREQMAVLFARYAEYIKAPLNSGISTFMDSGSISAWAIAAVGKANAAGLLLGYPDGTFLPQNAASRAEVATIFERFMTNCLK